MRSLLVPVMFFVALGLVGCDSSKRKASLLAKQANVLKVQIPSEPVSLDPATVEDGVAIKILANIMDGLVGYDGQGQLRNLLAESYEVSPDGKRYTFTLRKNAKWSDGRPVYVDDFVQGFRRSLSPAHSGKLSDLLLPIKGAREYRKGVQSGGRSDLPGVFEENGKLVIELERATPYFIQVLTLPMASPSRLDVTSDNKGAWPEKSPSTGPYAFGAHQPQKRLLLEANSYYWAGRPSIGLVDMPFVQDEAATLNLFEQGQIDIVTRVSQHDFKKLQEQGSARVDPFVATFYLGFNTRKPPFNDVELRRAVSGVIDRQEIAKLVETGETPARSWVPPMLDGFIPYQDPRPLFSKSVESVRSRLKKSPLSSVAMSFDSNSRNTMILEKVQQDLKKGLGMETSLSNLDWKSYVKSIQTDPTPIFRFGWLSPISDSIVHLEALTTGNPNNYTGWSDPRYDALVDEIRSMKPGPARTEKIRRAQQILVDEQAVIVPLYHYVQAHGVGPRVQGFHVNPFGVIRFDELTLGAPKAEASHVPSK